MIPSPIAYKITDFSLYLFLIITFSCVAIDLYRFLYTTMLLYHAAENFAGIIFISVWLSICLLQVAASCFH